MKKQTKKNDNTKELSSTYKAKSYFCVLNNVDKLFDLEDTTFDDPKYSDKTRERVEAFREQVDPNKTYDPEGIVDHLIDLWVTGKEKRRSCAINYEIGDNGVHHCHMILEDKSQARFSALQKLYPAIHVELTRGTKEQVTAYLEKTGEHEEKAHTIIIPMRRFGDIEGKPTQQGFRTDLAIIQELLEQGLTPEDIMADNLSYRKFSKIIKEHYYQMKIRQAPFVKDMTVFWHIGQAGTGKSFTQVILQMMHGREQVYVVSDYSNGGFDFYQGEPIVLLEEFKGDVSYQYLLKIIDAYPIQVHARYTNAYALWNTVHISSIYNPDETYKLMVKPEHQKRDPIEQLYRRIHHIVYHFKIDKKTYKTLTIKMEDYLDLLKKKIDLKQLAELYYQNDKKTEAYTYTPKLTVAPPQTPKATPTPKPTPHTKGYLPSKNNPFSVNKEDLKNLLLKIEQTELTLGSVMGYDKENQFYKTNLELSKDFQNQIDFSESLDDTLTVSQLYQEIADFVSGYFDIFFVFKDEKDQEETGGNANE